MEEGDVQWEELRREARKLEGDLDVKLSSYAKLGGMLVHGGYVEAGVGPTDVLGGGPDTSWRSMDMEIERLLARLLDVNDAMTRASSSSAAAMTSATQQKLARHRDILHEFTQEFKRTRTNISFTREHAELLTSVRNDISEYKASAASPSHLTERRAIHSNISRLDAVISHAQATKENLVVQRGVFSDIQGRLKGLSQRFPAVRNMIGAIGRARSRDTLILSGVVAACTIFLILYWLAK